MKKQHLTRCLVLLLTVSMVFVFSACGAGSGGPSKAAKTFLKSLKNQDSENMAAVYLGKEPAMGYFGEKALASMDANDLFMSAIIEKFMDVICSFDYNVSNERINGDTAMVDVTMETVNMGAIVENSLIEFMPELFAAALTGDAAGAVDSFTEIFKENVKNTEPYVGTATLSLTLVDGEWMVDEIDSNEAFMNLLTGNLLGTLEDINNMLNQL